MQDQRLIPTIAEIPVALLAGGMATRLGDISRQTPKALVDIGGRPFINHQLALLHHHGIRKVVMCLGHLGDQIEQHVGDGAAFGMEIQYSYDGPTLMGTGGAIRRALPMLGELFWVMYGDSYMDIDYGAILKKFTDDWKPSRRVRLGGRVLDLSKNASGSVSGVCDDAAAKGRENSFVSRPSQPCLLNKNTGGDARDTGNSSGSKADPTFDSTPDASLLGLMTVLRNDDQWDRSNVVFENGRLTCYDKHHRVPEMHYIDYGVQLLRREALLNLPPDQRCDLADLYHRMVEAGRMSGHDVFNRFYEIGTPRSLEETRQFLTRSRRPHVLHVHVS